MRKFTVRAGLIVIAALFGILMSGSALVDPFSEPPTVLSTSSTPDASPSTIPTSAAPESIAPTTTAPLTSSAPTPTETSMASPLPIQSPTPSSAISIVPRGNTSEQTIPTHSRTLTPSGPVAVVAPPWDGGSRWWENGTLWIFASIMILVIGIPAIGVWWFFWLRQPNIVDEV